MQDIKQLCVDNDVALIEDAAHAPIATDKNGIKAGTYGEFSASFSNKNIPAGEGGILSFNKNIITRMLILLNHMEWYSHSG